MVLPSTIIKKILQRVLEPFLVGFSTKDLSLSFLNGKAALRDVEVNVDPLNEFLNENPGTPVRFSRIHVSELSVQASVSKIKSRPLKLIIDEVVVEMEEPSVVLPPRSGAKLPGPPGPLDVPHKYALGDRIGDGISVLIKRVLVVVRMRGLLKDAPCGPWSPPCLVVELFGVSINSTDEQGRPCKDLSVLWHAVNRKMSEVMVFKSVQIERMVIKLIPTSPDIFHVDVKQRGPLPRVPGEAVILDQSPAPIKVDIRMRKKYSDSSLLGLMIHVEADTLNLSFRSPGCDGMVAHLLVTLLQCISRQGDVAWFDDAFRKRLWDAYDNEELKFAKVYGEDRTAVKKSFLVVEKETALASVKEEFLVDEDEDDDMDETTHSEVNSKHSLSLSKNNAPVMQPRIVIAVDIDELTIVSGSTGLDGGLKLTVRGLQVETLSNVMLPLSAIDSKLSIIEAVALNERRDLSSMEVVQVRMSDMRVESLHRSTADPVTTLLSFESDQSKAKGKGPLPLRFLKRGVERGFDVALDLASNKGKRGDFTPVALNRAPLPHVIGIMILTPKNRYKLLPFPQNTNKLHVEVPATISACMDLATVSLIPDYLTNLIDSRWFTGTNWPAGSNKLDATAHRVEPMQNAAPGIMLFRLRGGLKLQLPSPEDIPTLPCLTLELGALSVVKDHLQPRFCLDALVSSSGESNNQTTESEDESNLSLVPERWSLSLEELVVMISSLDSAATTAPNTDHIELVSMRSLCAVFSLDLAAQGRTRSFSLRSVRRSHSIDSMLALQRQMKRASNEVVEESEDLVPGLDVTYVTRNIEGTSQSISFDLRTVNVSGDLLALVAASQLVVYFVRSVALTSDTVASALQEGSTGTVTRPSDCDTSSDESFSIKPLVSMKFRLRATEITIVVPSVEVGSSSSFSLALGLTQGQLCLKPRANTQDLEILEVTAGQGMLDDLMLKTPEDGEDPFLVVKAARGAVAFDPLDVQARCDVEVDGLELIADSRRLTTLAGVVTRRWASSRVAVVGWDRSGGLFGDQISMTDFAASPMVYFDLFSNNENGSTDEGVEKERSCSALEGCLPPMGLMLDCNVLSLEVQFPPMNENDRWTVMRLSEIDSSMGLDPPIIDECRTLSVSGATTLALAHGYFSEHDEGLLTSALDDQLISPVRFEISVYSGDVTVHHDSIFDGMSVKCDIEPVRRQLPDAPTLLVDFPSDMGSAADVRLSMALQDSSDPHSSSDPLELALLAAGLSRLLQQPHAVHMPPVTATNKPARKSVPARRVSMRHSSTLAVRLPVGTVSTLQTLVDDQLDALQTFVALLVVQGWLPPDTLPTTERLGVVAEASVLHCLPDQVADDFIALGKSMVEARAVADQITGEVKRMEKERQFRERMVRESRRDRKSQQLRVGTSKSSKSSRPRLSSLTAASEHRFSDDNDESSDESLDKDGWEGGGLDLDRLRELERLLVRAQNLQSHTRANMNAQLSEVSLKQAELEAREKLLEARLKESEAVEAQLRKDLGRMERQFETSESKRLAEEEHHDRTVKKLQLKLDEALAYQSVPNSLSLDSSAHSSRLPSNSRPVSASSRSSMGKWLGSNK